MKKFALIITILSATFSTSLADERTAKQVTTEYDRAVRLWIAEMKLATDPRDREALLSKRPDPSTYAVRVRSAIRRYLDKPWSLTYSAWLLENDHKLRPGDQRALVGAAEKYHTLSPQIGRFCIALDNLRPAPPKPNSLPIRRRGMNLLQTIKKKNPDPKVQGQAALGLCMMMERIGDDHRILAERRVLLREAILKSADVKIGDITVADLAKEELYKMTNLTKGRLAPDFAGTDSASRPLRLSEFRGRVVMLVFWSSIDLELSEMATVMKLLRKTVDTYQGKPFILLGINNDPTINLRQLEGDAIATWRSFSDPQGVISKSYRIKRQPHCMILDRKGVIRYTGNLGTFATATVNSLLRK